MAGNAPESGTTTNFSKFLGWVWNAVTRQKEPGPGGFGYATPSVYRKTADNPLGWEPDQLVTWQGLENYVELALPAIAKLDAVLTRAAAIQYNQYLLDVQKNGGEPLGAIEIPDIGGI